MKFAIATKGASVAKITEICECFIIYEEKNGKIVLRQIIENSVQNPEILPAFLKKFHIKSMICGSMDKEGIQQFEDEGIQIITDISGNVDEFADQFALLTKKQAAMKSCLQPMPKVLVSCRGLDGENDVLAVGYCGNCSYDPPMVMVGIVPTRYSYHMIKESGCFVVNLVDKNYQGVFDYLGKHSKRDEDKLSIMMVNLQDGKKVNAPILPDCPVNIECTVVDSIVTGSHEMFIGKIEYVHANAELVDQDGNIDFSQICFL